MSYPYELSPQLIVGTSFSVPKIAFLIDLFSKGEIIPLLDCSMIHLSFLIIFNLFLFLNSYSNNSAIKVIGTSF